MLNGRALIDFASAKSPMVRLFIGSTSFLMLSLAGQMVAFVVLARYLNLVQFGQLLTITAITNLAGTWTGLGPAEVLRRRVSRDRSLHSEVLGHCIITIALTGILISMLVIGGMMVFTPVGSDRLEGLIILILLVPSNVILVTGITQTEFICLAHGDFTRANVINGCFGLMRAATAVVGCILFGVTSLRDLAAWWAAAHLIMLLACAMATRRYGAPRWRLFRNELWLGGSFALSNFLIMLRHNIDILVLNAIATPQFVGIYGAGRRVIGASLFVPGSFDRIVYGKFAAAGAGGPSATLRLAKRYLIYSMLISGATSLTLFLSAPLIPVIFGANFSEATGVVRILCWTVISTAVQFIAFDALNGADQHRVSAIVSGSANVAGAMMVAALGSIYGVFGIYAALYSSDVIRGGGLWLALKLLSRRQAQPVGGATLSI
jgi:O-antigen/teichoic acid export membrane protein